MEPPPTLDSQIISSPPPPSRNFTSQFLSWMNLSRNVILAYQSFGVVYGDLCTSPLYVYKNTFVGKLQDHKNQEEVIFGAFSLIFWTLTLIPFFKYVLIVLSADDNGEGGTFALYSLLCRHGKFSLLPNQQAADEELSTYKYGPTSTQGSTSLALKRLFEKYKILRTVLLLSVLLGACMVIGDGVITPAMSVLSSVSGLKEPASKLSDGTVVAISCIILVGLFALQHFGTHRVAFIFAPIVIIWLTSIFSLGLYNILKWNPQIVHALSPLYIVKFFRHTGKQGWISLGGVLLSITGTEAMFADLGHFTASSIRLAFVLVVYPCLVVQYMGQAAFLSKNVDSFARSFYDSVPDVAYWPVFVIATLASIVASQAIITATFSIIKQCNAFGCFPRVKVVHTSKHIFGQIYIPEINWILMIITLSITIGVQDTADLGNAYGIACMSVMFITTFLMTFVLIIIWQKNILLAVTFLLFFGCIEGVYLSSALMKVPQGGWVSLFIAAIFMFVMFVWQYGARRKYNYDLHNKVPLRWILGLGPSLGIVRVPGIGLIYSELATGVPPIFSHFVTNLPAFHSVLVFVCVKNVQVPHVSPDERFLIGRVCPRAYRMYRCIIRYGYKDIQSRNDEEDFEIQLIESIAEFIQMEAGDSSPDSASFDGRMAVISSRKRRRTTGGGESSNSGPCLVAIVSSYQEQEEEERNRIQRSSKSSTLESLRSSYVDENDVEWMRRRSRIKFELPAQIPGMDPLVTETLMDLVQGKDAGVAYIIGHAYVKARKTSPFFKKLVIDTVYSFLRKNCRGPSVALNIPHISLIEVGMTCYV